MKAYGKNVLVKPYPPPKISDGGLIVPDSVKRPSNKVLVVSVGEKVKKVKQGQTGFRVKNWGEPVELNGVLHFIMNKSAIIATV